MYVWFPYICDDFIGGLFSALGGSLGSNITKSNEKREKMDTSNTTYSNTWFVDELGWLGRGSKLIDGLESFYKKTGVQPLVYLAEYKEDYDLTMAHICLIRQKSFIRNCLAQMKVTFFLYTMHVKMTTHH